MSWYDIFLKDVAETEMRSQQSNNDTQQSQDSYCDCYADTLTFSQLFNNRYSHNTLSAVYACMEKISNSLAAMPLRVVQRDAEGHQNILAHHPLQRLFCSRTIQTMPMHMIIKTCVLDVLRRGNGYILIIRGADGQVTGLRYMDAVNVSI